jgi:hypothetical protein
MKLRAIASCAFNVALDSHFRLQAGLRLEMAASILGHVKSRELLRDVRGAEFAVEAHICFAGISHDLLGALLLPCRTA